MGPHSSAHLRDSFTQVCQTLSHSYAERLFHTGMSGQTTISDLQRALDATKQREATLTEQVHALQQRLDDERPSEKEQAAALKQKDHAIAAERTLIEDALDEERRREDDVLAAIERRQKDDAIAALERRQKDDALAALDGERRQKDNALKQKAEAEKELAAIQMVLRVEEGEAANDDDQEYRDALSADDARGTMTPSAKKRKYRSVFSFVDYKVINSTPNAGRRRRKRRPREQTWRHPARQWATKPETSRALKRRMMMHARR